MNQRDLVACPDIAWTVLSVVDNLCYDNVAVLAQLGLIPQGATA